MQSMRVFLRRFISFCVILGVGFYLLDMNTNVFDEKYLEMNLMNQEYKEQLKKLIFEDHFFDLERLQEAIGLDYDKIDQEVLRQDIVNLIRENPKKIYTKTLGIITEVQKLLEPMTDDNEQYHEMRFEMTMDTNKLISEIKYFIDNFKEDVLVLRYRISEKQVVDKLLGAHGLTRYIEQYNPERDAIPLDLILNKKRIYMLPTKE